jgi:hypothetical protein
MKKCFTRPSATCCLAFVADTLCCKLVELVDLDVAQIEEETGLLAGIIKNSVQKIHYPFGAMEA